MIAPVVIPTPGPTNPADRRSPGTGTRVDERPAPRNLGTEGRGPERVDNRLAGRWALSSEPFDWSRARSGPAGRYLASASQSVSWNRPTSLPAWWTISFVSRSNTTCPITPVPVVDRPVTAT